jgi:hypothetical protein
MAVILILLGAILNCISGQDVSFSTSDKAPWIVSATSDYNPALQQTVFSYKVTTYNNGQIYSFVAGIPSCPEIVLGSQKLARFGRANFRGVNFVQDIRPSSTWTYTVSVNGIVEAADIEYVAEGARISSGLRGHEYVRGVTIGPKCTKVAKVVCGISQQVHHGDCLGDTVRIPLLSTSKYYTTLKWRTDYAGCSFSAVDTTTPVITFHGPVCDERFTVRLDVWGTGHQHETCETTIIASDTSPPTFGSVYGATDITVSCDDIPTPLHVVGKDTCDRDVEVVYTEVEEDVDYGTYTILRKWVAIDDCDNKATHKQRVTVTDTSPPKLIGVPAHTTVDCGVEVEPCVVIATDNCDDVTVERDEQILEGSCIDSWKIIRTWIAEDSSHNAVTATQTVTVDDNSPPVLVGVPANVVVECDQVPGAVYPTAYDNCMEDVIVDTKKNVIPGTCPDAYTIRYNYYVQDECGNHVDDTWEITVQDTEAPTLSGAGKEFETAPCDNVPVPCVVQVIDNCAEYLSKELYPQVSSQAGSCEGEYDLYYVWSITDNCGNTASDVKTIQVKDIVPPDFSVHIPHEIKASCTAPPPPVMSGTDNCSPVTVVPVTGIQDDMLAEYGTICPYNFRRYLQWIVTDECGLTNSIEQTVHVIDDVPPVLIGIPPDMTIPCDGDYTFQGITVTATDNCDCIHPNGVQFYQSKKFDESCPYAFKLEYTWSVQDCCGHETSHVATITVFDESPPTLVGLPGSRYVSIENINDVTSLDPNGGGVTADDNCDTFVWPSFNEWEVPGTCEHNKKIIRQWTAEDVCGNVAESSQTIRCYDHTPPEFPPMNYLDAYECPEPALLPEVQVTDNGGTYFVDLDEDRVTIPGTCEDEYKIIRKFTAIDGCGNSATQQYTVFIHDTEPPVWTKDPCYDDKYTVIDTQVAYHGLCFDDVQAVDLCAGKVEVEFEERTTWGSCENEYMVVRSWVATDNCGNAISTSRTIDVKDQSPPQFDYSPPDTTIDCTQDFSEAYESPIASDYGYSGVLRIIPNFRVLSGQTCESNLTAMKCWTVHDCVGHAAEACQIVEVRDTTPPQFTYVPAHTTVPCDNIPVAQVVHATDDCGHALVRMTENIKPGTCDTEYTLERTYVATDECNLKTTYIQTIEVVDDTDPYFDYVPGYQNLECGQYSRYIAATCVDNCGPKPTVTRSKDDVAASCSNAKVDVRIWTCTDVCGNTAQADQTIHYDDVEAPQFIGAPLDVTLPCKKNELNLPPKIDPRCLDNCDNDVTPTYDNFLKPGAYGFQSSMNIRQWICEDDCGNSNTYEQTIVIYDDIPPSVVVPQSYILDCTQPYTVPTYLSVIDNCDPDPKVRVSKKTPYNDCHNSYTVEYTWCPYDKNGNEGICKSTTVRVEDPNPPTWGPLPKPYKKISYESTWAPDQLTADDYCDGVIQVIVTTVENVDLPCENEKLVIYLYSATDQCGNGITFLQTINVIDDVDPPLAPNPTDQVIDCPNPFPPPENVISDDPYSYVPLTVQYTQTEVPTTCQHEREIVRRWYVQDCAGNFNSVVQTLKIVDNGPPVLPTVEDKTFECEEDEYTALTAYDECDDYVEVDYTSGVFDDDEDCHHKVARLWVATDDCGNTDTEVQTLLIQDTVPPQIYGSPQDITVDNHNVPGMYDLQCSDNCGSEMFNAVYHPQKNDGSCPHAYTITRQWTCTDVCGHPSVVTQIITVQDLEPPTISYCPSDITVQMGQVPSKPDITAHDGQVYGPVDVDYNQTKVVTYDQTIMHMLYRTWEAEDDCGNSASCEQTITVIDTVPPIIPDVPRDQYVNCLDPIITNWTGQYHLVSQMLVESIQDAGNVDIYPYFPNDLSLYPAEDDTKVVGTCKGEYTLKRTWTATDHAGNSLSDSQVIIVVDDIPPTWVDNVLPSITAECKHDDAPDVTAEDDCEYSVVPNLHETRKKGKCAYDYTVFRIWTVEDACGNAISQKQTVYVHDTNPPDFTSEPDADETVECTSYNTMPAVSDLMCDDECSGEITPVYSASKHAYTCADSWIIARSWVCTDYCGHTSYRYQTITLEDTQEPVWGGSYADDINQECEGTPPFLSVTATDACADYVAVNHEIKGQSLGYANAEYVEVWTASDDCGNVATKDRTVHIIDSHDPIIYPKPPSQVIPCDVFSAYVMPEPHCEDNCGAATLTRDIVTTPGTCDSEYELEVTWTCIDQHDREDNHTMIITVTDNEAPVLNTHDRKVTVPCDDLLPTASVTASDNCDVVTVDFDEVTTWPDYVLNSVAQVPDLTLANMATTGNVQQGNWGQLEINVYYNIDFNRIPATRLAGKSSSLENCALQCYFDNNCAGAQLYTPYSLVDTGDTYCYLYDDDAICAVQHEAYKVPDTQTNAVTQGTAGGKWIIRDESKLCHVEPIDIHICDNYEIERKWVAEDNCGNRVEKIHSVSVVDLEAPVFNNVPADVTMKCEDNQEYIALADNPEDLESAEHGILAPTAYDNCSPEVKVVEVFDFQKGPCDDANEGIFTWTATDDCGLTTTASMTITKADTLPPTLAYIDPEIDVECDDPLPAPKVVTSSDLCNTASVTISSVNKGTPCIFDIHYTWTAIDECGNTATATQIWHVADTTPPTLTVPADEDLSCVNFTDATYNTIHDDAESYYGGVEISYDDDCGQATLNAFVHKIPGECPWTYKVVIRWVASDECGNKVEKYTTISVTDNGDPTMQGVPQDTDAQCDTVYTNPGITTSDDCGDVKLVFSEDIKDYDCASTGIFYKVYRKWVATDDCGHNANGYQTVTVRDLEDPVINAPQDKTIMCDAEIPMLVATATDDCGFPTLTDETKTLSGSCDDEYQVIKKWTAVDKCGKVSYKSVTISVIDARDPVLHGIPNNEASECHEINDVPNVRATDDCSNPHLHFNEVNDRTGYGCHEYTITRTWWAIDDCGNSETGSYIINVTDDTPPIMDCAGMDDCINVNIECEIYPPLPPVTAHDNCYEHVEIAFTSTPTTGSCDHDHTELRVWSTTDACGGHEVSIDQLVTYYDLTAPTLEGYVDDVTVECPNGLDKPHVTANDNCDYALTIDYDYDTTNHSCHQLSVEYRRWSATDLCGNTDYLTQTVTVVDTTPPTLIAYSTHAKVQCHNLKSTWHGSVTAQDDCEYDLTVKFTEEKIDGTCEDAYTLIREWSAEDCSGNTATHTQTVSVHDTIPPYFVTDAPSDETVTQDDVYSGAAVLFDPFSVEAADNCADPTVKYEEITLPIDYDCDYMYYRIRTWSIHDDCGNTDQMTQTIDMVDTTEPELEGPADITVECDSVPPPCDVQLISDDYQTTLTFREHREDGSCDMEYLIIRKWTAADCADNVNIVTQTVTVIDSTPPVLTRYPEDTTIECDCDELTSVPTVDAVDNCDLGGDEVVYNPSSAPGTCKHEYTLTRSWSATDSCGNVEDWDQEVEVVDSEPPLFCDEFCDDDWAGYGNDISCDELPEVVDPLVKDDCDTEPDVEKTVPVLIEPYNINCASDKKYTHQWTAMDLCGNVASCDREIIVTDTSPPHCTNCDKFCYPPPTYGATGDEYAVYHKGSTLTQDHDWTSLVGVADNCGTVASVLLLHCNSTEHTVPPGDSFDAVECVYFPASGSLYVHLVNNGVGHGREYYVWFRVEDDCGITTLIKRTIWIPSGPYLYQDAVDRGECPYGIGTTEFVGSLPVVL